MNFRAQIFILVFILSCNVAIGQGKKCFVNKADENIKRILVYSEDPKKDVSDLNTIIEFNKKGKIIKESQPEFHIHTTYKYDKKGRVVEKEALFGESFANGITTYEYSDGLVIEKNQAMGFYSEIRNELDKSGKPVKITNFYIAGGMGESKIETINFTYNNNGLLSDKNISVSYFDLVIETGEIQEIKPEMLISKLKVAKVSKKEQFIEKNTYNSAKNLIRSEFLNNKKELQYHITYEYNNNGLLIRELKVCVKPRGDKANYPCDETKTEQNYNIKNELESITTQRDNYLTTDSFKDGRLVSSIEKYSSNLSYQYKYKYEYYTD